MSNNYNAKDFGSNYTSAGITAGADLLSAIMKAEAEKENARLIAQSKLGETLGESQQAAATRLGKTSSNALTELIDSYRSALIR